MTVLLSAALYHLTNASVHRLLKNTDCCQSRHTALSSGRQHRQARNQHSGVTCRSNAAVETQLVLVVFKGGVLLAIDRPPQSPPSCRKWTIGEDDRTT